MELTLQNPLLRISLFRESRVQTLQGCRRTTLRTTTAAGPETVISVAVAAAVVGAAATLLVKRTKASQESQNPVIDCEDCGGSGVCSECKGEGFVLQKLSQERADRARKISDNAATRFTAGLPRKWSYCTKCSSGRSCITCSGSGKLPA